MGTGESFDIYIQVNINGTKPLTELFPVHVSHNMNVFCGYSDQYD